MALRKPLAGGLLAIAVWASVGVCVAAQAGLDGVVFAPDGKPAAGAEVRLYYLHDTTGYGNALLAKAQADQKGKFALTVPAFDAPPITLGEPIARLALVARAPGFAPGVTFLRGEEGEPCEIFLDRGRDLACTVTGRQGIKPVADAEVAVAGFEEWVPPGCCLTESAEAALSSLVRELYHGRTDENGRIVFEGVPRYVARLEAIHEDVGMQGPFEQNDEGDVTVRLLSPVTRFEGKVIEAGSGKPVQGALISPNFAGPGDVTWAVTDKEGVFRFPCLSRYAFYRGFMVRDPRAEPRFAAAIVTLSREEMKAIAKVRAVARKQGEEIDMAQAFKIEVQTGKLLEGKLTDAETGAPIAGAAVTMHDARSAGEVGRGRWRVMVQRCRLTDAQGRFWFRVVETEVTVGVERPPAGYALRGEHEALYLEMVADRTPVELKATLAPAPAFPMHVQAADGTPAAAVDVRARRGRSSLNGKADAKGRLVLTTRWAGGKMQVYAISADKKQAAMETLKVRRGDEAVPLDLRLRPARAGTVAFQNEEGDEIPGFVYVAVTDERGERWFWLARPSGWRRDRQAEEVSVGGLLPGVPYMVSGYAPGHTPAWGGQGVRWLFGEDEQEPRVVLRFKEGVRHAGRAAGRVPPAVPPAAPRKQRPTKEDFEKAVASFQQADWTEQDPVQKHLKWYGLDGGIALADSEKQRVLRYPGLFGFETIAVRDVAFGGEHVWFATNRGLLAWDRKLISWSRLPGDGVDLDMPVTEVSVGEGSILRLTVQREGEEPRRFLYDPQTMEWKQGQ